MIACAGVPHNASLTVMRGWSQGRLDPLVVASATERLSTIAALCVRTACHVFITLPPESVNAEYPFRRDHAPRWRRWWCGTEAQDRTARVSSHGTPGSPPPATAGVPAVSSSPTGPRLRQ